MTQEVPSSSLRPWILWGLALGLVAFLAGLAWVQQAPAKNVIVQVAPPIPLEEDGLPSGEEAVAVPEEDAPHDTQAPARSQMLEKGENYWEVTPPEAAETADNQWITLMVQNKSRLDLVEVPDASKDWEVGQDGQKLKIQFRSEVDAMKDILSRRNRGKYAIQLLSVPEDEFQVALDRVRTLMQDGRYAYLYRTEKPYEGKHWFRVRVGFFKNVDEAKAMGKEIYEAHQGRKLFPPGYWPVLPTPSELSRELIDLRQAINKPWVVQPPSYDTFQEAVQDLARFSSETELSYLSMWVDPDSGKATYRIRVGFYEQSGEASYVRTLLRRSFKEFQKARIISL